MASPVASQCQSCDVVKDSPQVDGGIGLIFATIGCFFGVQFCILRSSFRTSRKRNPLQFGRLISEIHDNFSPFLQYENTGTLSLIAPLRQASHFPVFDCLSTSLKYLSPHQYFLHSGEPALPVRDTCWAFSSERHGMRILAPRT